VAADFAEHYLGRIGEARRLRLQLGGREESGGDAQRRGGGVHRRLVHLQIDRDDAGDGTFGQAVRRQRFAHQGHDLPRLHSALAADADGKHRRV
jgi:hypothetical protein